MSSEAALFTRCPGCATVFRVSAAQLALREGQVRCGHCRAVFDANKERVSLDAPRRDDGELHDELLAGRPTVTLRNAEALQPVDSGATVPDKSEAPSSAAKTAPESSSVAAPTEAAPADVAASANNAGAPIHVDDVDLRPARFEWAPRKSLRERPKAVYGAAIVALLAVLAAQALFEYRDALAAHAPFTRPVLQAACGLFGCTVGPLRDAGALSIDASDLRIDPAHRGLLKLSATIRNRASYPIAWPYLELTLTDASDRVVARRAFAPGDYASVSGDTGRGIPANGEDVVTLFLDASETSQSGYRLYLFYP